jgi:hypothetical protein
MFGEVVSLHQLNQCPSFEQPAISCFCLLHGHGAYSERLTSACAHLRKVVNSSHVRIVVHHTTPRRDSLNQPQIESQAPSHC